MENDEVISKLLALKRHERPPEGYHTSFLYEFRRRQRASLMRRNPFSLFFENLSDLWPDLHIPRFAYAGIAAAAAVVAGIALLSTPVPSGGESKVALAESRPGAEFSLATQRPVTISGTVPASTRPAVSQHYVLQPRPASNDRPLSF